MEGIMIDVRQRNLLPDVESPAGGLADIENGGWGTTDQDTKHPSKGLVLGNMPLRDLMFAFVFVMAENHRNMSIFGIGMNSPAESPGEPHEVGIVESAIITHQPAPPSTESPGGMNEREISIEHDTVNTIVGPIQEVLILFTEFILCLQSGSPRRSLCRII